MVFLPVQCRMARAALGLGVRELAAAAKVASDTIVRFERGDELKARTVEAIRDALESAGVEFIDENGGGPGVRLRKSAHSGAPQAVSRADQNRCNGAPRRDVVEDVVRQA
jgi:transcriptional regulator with XRE-family HTH domain